MISLLTVQAINRETGEIRELVVEAYLPSAACEEALLHLFRTEGWRSSAAHVPIIAKPAPWSPFSYGRSGSAVIIS